MRSTMAMLTLIAATVVVMLPWESLTRRGAEREITFVVWGMPFEDRLFEDRYARGFERVRDGVIVDYQRHPDVRMKYNAWHALGDGAEVMRIEVPDYHQFVERGMLKPLSQYFDHAATGLSEDQISRFPAELWENLHVDGEVYALPADNAQFGLYYNRAIFDAYDAAHPEDPIGHPDETWTWDDLRDAARKLTTRDAAGRVQIHGFDLIIWQWPFMNFFVQAGGNLWDEVETTTLVNSEAGVAALAFFGDLIADGSWSPTLGVEQGAGPDNAFATGRVAMYLDGSWRVPNFEMRNPDLDFAVAPVPQCPLPGARIAISAGATLWGVSANSDHPEEGWRMVRWLVSPAQALAYWDVLRVAPPADVRIVESPAFRRAGGVPGREPGTFEVPPMSPETFEARAAWLEFGLRPHPETGQSPGFVPTAKYQRVLEDAIASMLNTYLSDPEGSDPRALLAQVERDVHAVIDRDRAAKGLTPVAR